MPRIFNAIRQRLLKENRITRYLAYAVGEIVLVVVGILIALQINNWNEGRKLRLRQVDLINALILDLNAKMEENMGDLKIGERLMAKAEKALQDLGSGAAIDTADVRTLLRNMAADEWRYMTTTPSYTSIINSDLWQQLPDTLAIGVQRIYDHHSNGLRVCFEKHSEYATHCRLTYLAPHGLLDLDQDPMALSMKIAEDPEAFRVHLTTFMSGVYRLIKFNGASGKAIEAQMPALISYRDELAGGSH
ncbi:MAG: hypothetical protein JNM31_12625 [Flavobacteriales bacterium]|nr:hypothetical protein [Flavobacteriales bacterium]